MGSNPSTRAMDIIVSDFDGVLFKKYYGLIQPTVDYLNERGLPVYVVTYRMQETNEDFIYNTLKDVIPLRGMAFSPDRKKNPLYKVELVEKIRQVYSVVEALDNDPEVVLHYRAMGIPVIEIT